ncbi:Helix-turn-helix [Pseudobutyrivibrio sp. UC1225]|uniref:helix-turn-helix domain-containing protein n=1 Tax=Pseudobutyrivibrio sp. UC1225 TaxID=1798185 RepID=UPI0008E7F9B4|nr:helix-turn-helix transcriptional regulator [Pseudobutyrivibrio sp. UC1225]SFO16097.1 Helix-turn-helix [Pseudobutyrivibrio sp. UC1225]
MDILDTFATNVKKYRQAKNISQEKLAEISGLHRTYISDIERSQRSISLNNVQKIANALDVPTYKLFMSENEHI